MTIEMANRLSGLRNGKGLSIEEVSQKINVPEENIQKWENAELSPDADNIIKLTELYGVSADYLINGDSCNSSKDSKSFHIGSDGIHIQNDSQSFHMGKNGINATDDDGEQVEIDKNHVHISDKDGDVYNFNGDVKQEAKKQIKKHTLRYIPLTALSVIIFLILGFAFNAWYVSWTVFLLVPIIESLIKAICDKNAEKFAFPVLIVFVYCIIGLLWGMWHPYWIMFLLIPIYYSLIKYFKDIKKE